MSYSRIGLLHERKERRRRKIVLDRLHKQFKLKEEHAARIHKTHYRPA